MPYPRKSIERHKIEGTYRASDHARRREVKAAADLSAEPPSHLSEAERLVWHEVHAVAPPKLLKDADAFTVTAFVCAVSAHRQATTAQAREPMLITAGNGATVLNPLLAEARRQARLILEYAVQLGMVPQARLRMQSDAPAEKDGMDAEFARMYGGLRLIPGKRS